MLIRDLFVKDPCRKINPIIQAGERSPSVLGLELDEYVVTEEVEGHLRRALDEFVGARPGRVPDSVCLWVSGWFGSGKSHFLKFLGSLLANPTVELPGGSEVSATPYLCQKWNLPFEHHLLELRTRVVPINLLNYVTGTVPGLSEIVYRGLMSDSGFSDEPWVAEMERLLTDRGLYPRFKAEVEAEASMTWERVRAQPVAALPLMAKALVATDPETWGTVELAERAIERQELQTLTPALLGDRLHEEAVALDPDGGRLVVLLDEVGLYVGDVPDRYLELKAIAEAVARSAGYGKVWLIVTSQEAPEEKVAAVMAREEEMEWLRDRFPIKLALTPENIETVVRERLLKKSDAGTEAVVDRCRNSLGALSAGATIRGVQRRRDVFEAPDASAVAASYPLLPYQVRLTTEVIGELRARGSGAEGLTGRERTVLAIAQSAFCNERRDLADGELGSLVTLADTYDAIVGDTRLVPTSHEAEIRELDVLGAHDDVPVQAVAKALYLLQQIPSWLPATAENIAAGLYPNLGARPEGVLNGVRAGLAVLLERNYIGEQESSYRFLSEEERTFEQDVQRAQRNIGGRRERLAMELLKELLNTFGRLRYLGGIRVFDVAVQVDGSDVSATGNLRLVVQSPLGEDALDLEELEREVSPSQRDTVWLVTEPSVDLRLLVDRALGIEGALATSEVVSREGQQFRRERERELETLRHVTLPTRLREAFSRATIVQAGLRQAAGSGWEDAVGKALAERAAEVFYEFSAAAAIVRDEDISRILAWQGGPLPECYRALQIVDGDRIRESSPLLSRILEEVKRRDADHEPSTGRDVLKFFDDPPYGWDEKAVRLGLAALFRNGSIEMHTAHGVLRSFRDPAANRALTNRPAFREAAFRAAVVVTEAQRREAAALVARWFGETGAEAPEQIDDALRRGLARVAADAEHLARRLADFRLGGAEALRSLAEAATGVAEAGTPAARILAVLDGATRDSIEAGIKHLESVRALSGARNLEKTRDLRQFVTAFEPVEAGRARQLEELLEADDFAERWPTLFQTFQTDLGRYQEAYRTPHDNLVVRVAAVVKELQAADAAGVLSDDLGALTRLSCSEASPRVDEAPYRCPSCRRSIGELERDRFAIEQEQRRLLLLIAEQEQPPTEIGAPRPPLVISERLDDRGGLARVWARIEAYSVAAFSDGPVQLEVNVRSGGTAS